MHIIGNSNSIPNSCASRMYISCLLTSTTTNAGKGCQTNYFFCSQASSPNTKVSIYYNIKLTNYAFTVRLPQTEVRASAGQTYVWLQPQRQHNMSSDNGANDSRSHRADKRGSHPASKDVHVASSAGQTYLRLQLQQQHEQ